MRQRLRDSAIRKEVFVEADELRYAHRTAQHGRDEASRLADALEFSASDGQRVRVPVPPVYLGDGLRAAAGNDDAAGPAPTPDAQAAADTGTGAAAAAEAENADEAGSEDEDGEDGGMSW